ncbi:MAG: hypothetical protein DMF44_15195 [Verrucomicrobia bacterium]|nr:MAG: hypothetical protein DMF44_15195 [Verrucomicrobiota bacterium]
MLLGDRHASNYVRSVRGKLCAAFSFGPGSARGSRVGGRALSIANFSGVQIHFAALLTTFGRGRRNCAREPPALPGKRVGTVAILLIHSVANLVIISGGKRADCWSALGYRRKSG